MFRSFKVSASYNPKRRFTDVVGNDYNANYREFARDLIYMKMDDEIYVLLLEMEDADRTIFHRLFAAILWHEYAVKCYNIAQVLECIEYEVIGFINNNMCA